MKLDTKYHDAVRRLGLQVHKAIRQRDARMLDQLWWKLRGWQEAIEVLRDDLTGGNIQDLLRLIEQTEAEQSRESA